MRAMCPRVKGNNPHVKVELFINGELQDPANDKRLLSQLPQRDKLILSAKLTQANTNMPSSPDSSSDSSEGSPSNPFDGPNVEAEGCLPGVLMTHQPDYVKFLLQLADLGSSLNIPALRDRARAVLKLMPAGAHTVEGLRTICLNNAKLGDQSLSPVLESVFFDPSPSLVLYCLEVVYTLLMPAHNTLSEETQLFQFNFFQSGGVNCVLGMLAKKNFLLHADIPTKRAAYLMVLKLAKLLFTVVINCIVQVAIDNCHNQKTTSVMTGKVEMLTQARMHLPNPNSEYMLRSVAMRLSHVLHEQGTGPLPDLCTVKSIIKLCWASSCGSLHLLQSTNEAIHQQHEMVTKAVDLEDSQLCREALEVLSLTLALCPESLDTLMKDNHWHVFILDLILMCRNRSIRASATEQFTLMATKCYPGHQPLIFYITLLFTQLKTTVQENAKNSHEFFQLLCRLLNYASGSNCLLPTAQNLLYNEIDWLKEVRENIKTTGSSQVDEVLLEGHLGITRELVSFLGPDKKFEVGAEPSYKRGNLIQKMNSH
ncbi:ubiquitin carboxyl-terminal hydrolase 9X-like isoform X2 [Tachypleus tridentatus]|uniref:ubiquitin carboxyl-terminal hydrolase 9X-like isoform X2 n=1 Tax=Tachypleus tridentatus TaxID=6853 RepID=UPI003FD22AB9